MKRYRLHTYDKATGRVLGISGPTSLVNAHRIAVNDALIVDVVAPAGS